MQSNTDTKQLEKDTGWILKYFLGTECLCGKNKKKYTAFCYGDFKALPRDLQRKLRKRFGQGFEEAVNEAVIYLQSNEW